MKGESLSKLIFILETNYENICEENNKLRKEIEDLCEEIENLKGWNDELPTSSS
jgi:cell division septum initiation protein DivIVA